jgi:catechol 2,3-dioxygenase-like lactoylglutathione lyase family enzyme
MSLHGVSHIGLSTLDFEATRTFYEDVLGFRLVTIEQIDFEEGGSIRHAFFECGDGQLLGFMEPRGIQGLPAQYDTGINQSLGLPEWFYHFAFNAGSIEELHAKRADLIAKASRSRQSLITSGCCRSTSRIPTACCSSTRCRRACPPTLA